MIVRHQFLSRLDRFARVISSFGFCSSNLLPSTTTSTHLPQIGIRANHNTYLPFSLFSLSFPISGLHFSSSHTLFKLFTILLLSPLVCTSASAQLLSLQDINHGAPSHHLVAHREPFHASLPCRRVRWRLSLLVFEAFRYLQGLLSGRLPDARPSS